jgi:nicotinamide mononucleotide adenylyltransferase
MKIRSPRFAKLGMVARWKPVHLGHTAVLRGLCRAAEQVVIGIGSSNRYNVRNPFTVSETRDMLTLALAAEDNWQVIEVPDLDDGARWRVMVHERLGDLSAFVTENPYVSHLMQAFYPIYRPVYFVPPAERIAIDGTMVRLALARGADWRALVSPAIADYLVENQLDQRFCREFGAETLALQASMISNTTT